MFLSVVDRLGDVVNQYGARPALISDDNALTYNDLWSELQSCSLYMHSIGLKKGDRVALLLNNSFEYVSSYYGVLSCGGVIVSLNTTAKETDIINWIKHSGATTLITDTDLYSSLEGAITSNDELHVVLIDKKNQPNLFWSTKSLDVKQVDILNATITGKTVASIIYTSGTTGNPKGVTLSHGNFIANFTEVINYLDLGSSDSIVNILPFYYSYGNSILHTHLLAGATIVLENNFMYPAKTMQKIAEHKITGFSGVPATFAILLNKVDLKQFDLTSLRYVTQAGGPMPPTNIQKFIDILADVRFYVMYGQTEATARLTFLEPEMLLTKMGSVGKPLSNINIEIRDDDNNSLGPNIEGEIFVSGPNIMTGYWNDVELTRNTIDNGFLKTGDLGYIDDDGFIYLTGRRSDMIKVGGNRISPLEIEEVVCQINGIIEVAATGVADDILGQVIKLTVVTNSDYEISEKQIKAFCRKNLALYKIPKYIEFVDSLPKTASGKVKRYLL